MSQDPASPPRERPGPLAAVAALALALGVLAGWLAATQRGRDAPDAPASRPAGPPALDARTLAELGVEVGAVAPGDHWLVREVPAVVAPPPEAARPVTALVGGWVRRVLVRRGQEAAAGAPLLEVVRDPFPRPELALTDAVLRPLNEEYHEALTGLRTAREALDIASAELARVRAIVAEGGGGAPLATKTEVDLAYAERRARGAYANARHEAERHGMTEEEIARVEAGGDVLYSLPAAQRVLKGNRLWSEGASRLLAALPEAQRELPYATAVLGELAGAGLLPPALVEAALARPRLAASFLDLAGLVQRGWTVPALVALEEAGALEAVHVVRAPEGDWDVVEVPARSGQRVEAGATLAVCLDPRRVLLELHPSAGDLEALRAALRDGTPARAEPLLPGAGPTLEGLALLRLEGGEGGGEGAAHGRAWAEAAAEPLARREAAGARFRTWSLRAGQRYVVEAPWRRLEGVFVVPAGAVVLHAAQSALLLEDGDSFRPVAVRVLHRDARSAVVAQDGAVFPGDRVVLQGAAALALTIEAASGAGAHAGHGHPH